MWFVFSRPSSLFVFHNNFFSCTNFFLLPICLHHTQLFSSCFLHSIQSLWSFRLFFGNTIGFVGWLWQYVNSITIWARMCKYVKPSKPKELYCFVIYITAFPIKPHQLQDKITSLQYTQCSQPAQPHNHMKYSSKYIFWLHLYVISNGLSIWMGSYTFVSISLPRAAKLFRHWMEEILQESSLFYPN